MYNNNIFPQVIIHKFSEIFKYDMSHYLMKYALICTHFRTEIWTLDKTSSKILVLFCWCVRVQVFYRGDFGYLFLSLHKSENTLNRDWKKRHVLGVKYYNNQVNRMWANCSVKSIIIWIGVKLLNFLYVSDEVKILTSPSFKAM